MSAVAAKHAVAIALLSLAGCATRPPALVRATAAPPMTARGSLTADTAPKEDLRLVPPEVYVRTYLGLFGGLAPLDVQKRARGADNAALFDAWGDYVSALGFPDYRIDIPRQTQTNALMVATFERLGVALCDRAVEHDLEASKTGALAALNERVVFAFEPAQGDLDVAAFAPRFDVLHRTFLGYPAALAPPSRTARFFALYRDIVAGHARAAPHSRFTPDEAGWASVCYGLVRHPEFHLY